MYQEPTIIKRVGEALTKPISPSSEDLDIDIIQLESLRFPLAEATVDSMKLLYEKRKQMLWPRDMDKKLTELDREVRLKGDLAPIERDNQFLMRLEQMVEQRISLLTILRR